MWDRPVLGDGGGNCGQQDRVGASSKGLLLCSPRLLPGEIVLSYHGFRFSRETGNLYFYVKSPTFYRLVMNPSIFETWFQPALYTPKKSLVSHQSLPWCRTSPMCRRDWLALWQKHSRHPGGLTWIFGAIQWGPYGNQVSVCQEQPQCAEN